jgi:hypothetical protein
MDYEYALEHFNVGSFVGRRGMPAAGGAGFAAESGDPGGLCVGDHVAALRCASESAEV